jgi:hypothetical protein
MFGLGNLPSLGQRASLAMEAGANASNAANQASQAFALPTLPKPAGQMPGMGGMGPVPGTPPPVDVPQNMSPAGMTAPPIDATYAPQAGIGVGGAGPATGASSAGPGISDILSAILGL